MSKSIAVDGGAVLTKNELIQRLRSPERDRAIYSDYPFTPRNGVAFGAAVFLSALRHFLNPDSQHGMQHVLFC